MDRNRGMGIGIRSKRGTGMRNNLFQDRAAPLTVNNIVSPLEDDGIGGWQLLYLE